MNSLNSLKELLRKKSWEDVWEESTVNDKYAIFLMCFLEHLDTACPLKSFKHEVNKTKIS